MVADMKNVASTASPSSLLAFMRKERENLVLKPSDEYGGTGVTLGWEASESAWDAAIEKARFRPQNGVLDRSGTHPDPARGFSVIQSGRDKWIFATCWWISLRIFSAESFADF